MGEPKMYPKEPPKRRPAPDKSTPVGDSKGYSYGRGKGTPTFNMKKPIANASLVKFRAGERASAAKPTGRSTAKPVKETYRDNNINLAKFAGEVGANVSKGLNDVNRGIQGALKSSPGLKSQGIKNVMSLKPKK